MAVVIEPGQQVLVVSPLGGYSKGRVVSSGTQLCRVDVPISRMSSLRRIVQTADVVPATDAAQAEADRAQGVFEDGLSKLREAHEMFRALRLADQREGK